MLDTKLLGNWGTAEIPLHGCAGTWSRLTFPLDAQGIPDISTENISMLLLKFAVENPSRSQERLKLTNT